MHKVLETGKPILIDLLTNRAGTFVVTRIPLRDPLGEVIGALGIVLFDHAETNLQPLVGKFALLQRDLDDARRELASQRISLRQTQRGGQGSGLRQSRYTFASFVGASPAAVEVKRQARRAAQSSSPVLLLGETGTGKELLAHAIHAASNRADQAFVSINIAAVPDTLLEAEFFGVAPGAFTGADPKGREGKFRLAHGGTLFLDEIGDMPLSLQAKLLRALQEGEIEPLGSNQLLPFDARVIAATSRGLNQLVREGQFREDLFYRLNVLPIRVPPLRDRPQDIPALVEVLGDDMAIRSGGQAPELSTQAFALLAAQVWRGNIRELRNVLEQAMMRSDTHQLGCAHLEAVFQESGVAPRAPVLQASALAASPMPASPSVSALLRPWSEQVAELEGQAIAAALQAAKGNKAAAAKMLGISRATLYARLV
jgi:transcriptional regulator with PAS, ATPase and Fis domain